MPTSSGQGREILLIQQSIQTNIRGILEGTFLDTIHGALALIYSHRLPWLVLRNPDWIRSQIRKGIRIQKGQQKHVCRWTDPCLGRPCGRPLLATVNRVTFVYVVHTGRLGAILACFNALFLLILISDLCAIFLYLLCPYSGLRRP